MSEELIDAPPVRTLSKAQRRAFGALLEKSFTTPEYYPMTLKAITAACNQKNNRDPLTNYSEDDVAEALEELRKLQLVAVVHTESGRTERYRHYARKRFTFTEPQLAIMTELLLRGRQSLGELRSRASRMLPIDTLDQLRQELEGLLAANYIQATGSLERRGVEVDHTLYEPHENRTLRSAPEPTPHREVSHPATASVPTATGTHDPPEPPPGTVPVPASDVQTLAALERLCESLRQENRNLQEQIDRLTDQVEQLNVQFAELRASLGG